MARKSPASPAPSVRKPRRRTVGAARKSTAAGSSQASSRRDSAFALPPGMVPDFSQVDVTRMAKAMTPEQAMELYKANAALALDLINAAIENTARLRKLQFEGEEGARAFQKKHVRSAATASDPQALMAAGQGAAQEAVEMAMRYWGEMFDMISEMQKRLFTLMEGQMAGMPGAQQAKAAMAMMPDMTQAQNVVNAMRGLVGSGSGALSAMQRVVGDMARMAQGSMRPKG